MNNTATNRNPAAATSTLTVTYFTQAGPRSLKLIVTKRTARRIDCVNPANDKSYSLAGDMLITPTAQLPVIRVTR